VGGGMQVAVSFFKDLNDLLYENDEFIFLVSYELHKKIITQEYASHIRIIAFEAKHSKYVILRALRCKSIEREIRPDHIFVLFGPSYHKSAVPKTVGFARPHYIYSNSPYFSKAPIGERLFMLSLMKLHEFLFIKNSDAIIFETEDARRIMQEKIFKDHPISLFVVGNTLNNIFLEDELWVNCEKLERQLNRFNCLCVSANYTHKNISILKSVARYLIKNFPDFRFCFTLTLSKEEFQLDDELVPYFNLIGSVNHNELPDLYTKCDAFILPTLLEVFSTSYLEAMFMEKPILTSDLGFAHDICGDAALYFDPLSAENVGEVVYQLALDKALQEKLVTLGNNQLRRFTDSKGRTMAYMDIIRGKQGE